MTHRKESSKRDSRDSPPSFKGRFERQRAEEADKNRTKERESRRRQSMEKSLRKSPPLVPTSVKKARLERDCEDPINSFAKRTGSPIEATVAVIRDGRRVFSVEETLQVRRFVMERMLELKAQISFINSGLIRASTLYLMTCGSKEEANKLVNLCQNRAKDRQWTMCRASELPMPPRIRGTVMGLCLEKDKILKFMKLVNHKLGLTIDEWKLVDFDRDRLGQRTTLTIEVPDKDAEIVRRIGFLGVELTQVKFCVLPSRRWADMEEGYDDAHPSSPYPPIAVANKTEPQTIEHQVIDELLDGVELKEEPIFPQSIPLPEQKDPSKVTNNPTEPEEAKCPADLYNSPLAMTGIDDSFLRAWKGMENFENMEGYGMQT